MSMATLLTRHRITRLTGVASTQLVVQAIAFLCGLVLVRAMEPAQYGIYTLALGMAGVAGVLADLGLANAVLAVGGRVGGRPGALGLLLADARALQVRLAWMAALVLVPGTAAFLLHQQAGTWQVVALTAWVVVAATLNVRACLALAVTRVLGHVRLQQQLDLALNFLKLGVLLMLAAAVTLDATWACLANLAVAAAWSALLHRHVAGHAQLPAAPPATAGSFRPLLQRQVWQQAPNAIYFVLSSQITVWLVGIFGSAERVAEVGALGRLAALFAVVGTVVAALVLPYFARRESPAEVAAGLASVNAFFATLLGLLLTLAWAAPASLLWVLGGSYGGLHDELAWMLAAATLTTWGGVLYGIGCARGWVLPFWLTATSGVLATAAAALAVDVATVRGAYAINTATGLAGTLVALGYLGWQLRRPGVTATSTP